ncbi:hypothetical protein [Singulisphaera sp. PoT]|uniref:hypothetical protein n=1 Tax=Singulisphaera sp. PoT TaxID=3411797 RepID=UPI003BF4BF7F
MAIVPARTVRVYVYQLPIKPTRVAPHHDRPFAEGVLPEETPLYCPIDQRQLPNINGSGLTCEESRRINGAKNRAFAEYARSCPEASLPECERVARKAAADEMRRLLKERPPAPPLKAAEDELEVVLLKDSQMTDKEARRVVSAFWRGYCDFENKHPGVDAGWCEPHGQKAADEMRWRISRERALAKREAEKAAQEPEPAPVTKPARKAGKTLPFSLEDAQWWAENSPTRNYGYEVLSMGRRWDRRADEAAAQHLLEVGLAS